MTNRFSHRTDLAQAQALLNDEIGTRETRLNALADPEAQKRSQRELDALRKLGQSKNVGGAIAALGAYLSEHPETPARAELQLLLDGLTAKQERKQLTRNILLCLAALAGVSLLILLFKLLLTRKQAHGSDVLTGTWKIDKRELTDPLTLMAQERRAGVKDMPLELPPPGESGLTK